MSKKKRERETKGKRKGKKQKKGFKTLNSGFFLAFGNEKEKEDLIK